MPVYKSVPGADQFYSLNEPTIGTPFPQSIYPQNGKIPKLFQPLTLRGMTFKNRIFVSPMCQYSSDNGHATDWHFVHVGGLATRGAGAICMEATAVVPEGRITPQDAGLYTDSQIAPLQRIVNFSRAHGTLIGVQLSHAGRKSSIIAPWQYQDSAHSRKADSWMAPKEQGGWPDKVYSASDVPAIPGYPAPKPMDEEHLLHLEEEWIKAIERCKAVGYDFVEIHGAHGYLIHQFLSPLSNTRTDAYGGPSLESRMRWPLRLLTRLRAAWDKPLFVRVNATDWAEGPEKGEDGEWKQWGMEQTKIFVAELKKIGVDLIDCTSGNLWARQKVPMAPGWQVPFAEELKKAIPDMPVGTVGLITHPEQAEGYLSSGKADVVFMAREFIRTPHWPMFAAAQLGFTIKPANQYERGFMDMLTPKEV